MNTKLYVGNLPYETTETEIEDLFAEAGVVQQTVLVQDRLTGKSRGFAFITMADQEGVDRAVERFNGFEFSGRALVVNIARPREDRPAGGGGGRRDHGDRRGGGGGGGGRRDYGDRRGGGGGRRESREEW